MSEIWGEFSVVSVSKETNFNKARKVLEHVGENSEHFSEQICVDNSNRIEDFLFCT